MTSWVKLMSRSAALKRQQPQSEHLNVKMKECPNYTSAGTEWVRYQANTIIIFINNILGISDRGAVQTQEHHLAEIDCD